MTIIEEIHMFYNNDMDFTVFVFDRQTHEVSETKNFIFDSSKASEELIVRWMEKEIITKKDVSKAAVVKRNNCIKLLSLENTIVVLHVDYIFVFVATVSSYIDYLGNVKKTAEIFLQENSRSLEDELADIPDTPEELEALYPPVDID